MSRAPVISLVPTRVDLALYSGDGVQLNITVNDSAGDPMPLTGSVNAQIRALRSDVATEADFSVNLADGDDGVVSISLTGDQTTALVNGSDKFTGFWDVQWVATGAEPVTLMQGNVTCSLDVTRLP